LALGKPHILVRQLKDLLCGLATIRVRAESITPIKAICARRVVGKVGCVVLWFQPIFHVQLVTAFQRTSHNLDWDFHLVGNSQWTITPDLY